MKRKRTNLSLTELLVVMGIIWLLGAMLLPMFAQARESARDQECLSNVRVLSRAIRMYVVDWGEFWPSEHDSRVIDYFSTAPGGASAQRSAQICSHVVHANPYLREPVVLEAYLEDRAVWKCPSARLESAARFIVPPGPGGDWLQGYIEHEGEWGHSGGFEMGPCFLAYPSGWGGAVTDSFEQGMTTEGRWEKPTDPGVFISGYGVNKRLRDLSPDAIAHPARYVVVGDSGQEIELWIANSLAYPDYCRMTACGFWSGTPGCCNAEWENCEWSRECGLDWSLYERFFSDAAYRRQFTRHVGGSFLGFADGHAALFPAETIVSKSPPRGDQFEGICVCWP